MDNSKLDKTSSRGLPLNNNKRDKSNSEPKQEAICNSSCVKLSNFNNFYLYFADQRLHVHISWMFCIINCYTEQILHNMDTTLST